MTAPIPTTADDDAARPTLWTPTFTAVALASLAYFTAAGALIPAVPRYVEGPLGGGNLAVGVVVGAFSVTAVLLRPLAGIVGDTRGRRPLMLAGAATFAVAVLAHGLATTATALVVVRLVAGAGEALFFVGAITAFTDVAPPERRGEAMSLASLSLYVGIGTGPVLAELVLARLGFGAVWLLTAATAGAALVLVLRVPETRPTVVVAGDAAPTGGRRRLVHRAGLLPGALLLVSIAGMAGFLTFLPLHVLDVGLGGAGPLLLLFAGTVVAVRSVGARLPDRLGPARAIRAACAVSAAGLATVGLWQSTVGLVVGAVGFGIGIALLTPSVFALAVAGVPADERGQVVATTSAFIDVAFGVGPVTMGAVAASFGRPAVFVTGAVLALAGLPLLRAATSTATGGTSQRVVALPKPAGDQV